MKILPDISVAQAQRLTQKMASAFAREFASRIVMPSCRIGKPSVALWLSPGGALNHARLRSHTLPVKIGQPFFLRIAVNCDLTPLPRLRRPNLAGLNSLRVDEIEREKSWGLELTILPREVTRFTRWIADLATARAGLLKGGLRVPHPLCKRAYRRSELHHEYQWSRAAWNALARWQEISKPQASAYGAPTDAERKST